MSVLLEGIGIYSLFVAFSREEVSRVLPLGALTPFLTLALGWLVLGELPGGNNLWAFLLFIAGGAVIATHFGRELTHITLSKALLPVLAGTVPSACVHVGFKFALDGLGFWAVFAYSRIGLGLFALLVFLLYAKRIIAAWRQYSWSSHGILAGNQAIAVLGHGFYFFAITGSVSVALINSMHSIRYIMVFLMASAVSFVFPRIFNESTEKGELAQKFIGIVLVGAALTLLYQ